MKKILIGVIGILLFAGMAWGEDEFECPNLKGKSVALEQFGTWRSYSEKWGGESLVIRPLSEMDKAIECYENQGWQIGTMTTYVGQTNIAGFGNHEDYIKIWFKKSIKDPSQEPECHWEYKTEYQYLYTPYPDETELIKAFNKFSVDGWEVWEIEKYIAFDQSGTTNYITPNSDPGHPIGTKLYLWLKRKVCE